MPHIEIKYSNNLEIDTDKLFDAIEKTINEKDDSAGVCKARAYPCFTYKYSHLLITISLLKKAKRDEVFTQNLSYELEKVIKEHLHQSAYFSLNIEYSLSYYTTNTHLVEGDALEVL